MFVHVSRVCRKDCVLIVEICTFMKGGNFEMDTFAGDVFMSKQLIAIRDMSPLFCAHSSHGKSFQHVPVR